MEKTVNTLSNIRAFSLRAVAPSRQKGNALLFAMLALVVAAILTIVAMRMYQASQRSVRIEAATSDLNTIIAAAQKLYGNSNQYGAVTTAIAIRGTVIPPAMRIAGTTTAQNRYYGAVTMAPATITTANDSLTLTYGNVNRDDCQDLVLGMESTTRRIAVGGTEVKPADSPVDIAAMSTACDSAATRDIAYTFGRGQ
jgi:Tfp pilus assembly protein PilE